MRLVINRVPRLAFLAVGIALGLVTLVRAQAPAPSAGVFPGEHWNTWRART